MIKKMILFITLSSIPLVAKLPAFESSSDEGIVNFNTCVLESQYGKHEQEQLENIRKQWSSLLENTQKELKELDAKFEDQEYLDSLSPEKESELKAKYKSLNEDMSKYQNQLYQVLNQAQYFFVQKMSQNIAKAASKVAKDKKLNFVMNKEACFYYNPDLEVTKSVIEEMDKNFEEDQKNQEKTAQAAQTSEEKKEEKTK